jgi:hypothetical protein
LKSLVFAAVAVVHLVAAIRLWTARGDETGLFSVLQAEARVRERRRTSLLLAGLAIIAILVATRRGPWG